MVPVARTNFQRQKGSSYLRGRGHLFLSKELRPQNHIVFSGALARAKRNTMGNKIW